MRSDQRQISENAGFNLLINNCRDGKEEKITSNNCRHGKEASMSSFR